VAVTRARHPAFAKRPSPKRFAALPQLLISPQGDAIGPVDRALAELGLARRVAMTVTHFAAAPFVIEASDLVAVMPKRVAHRMRAAAKIAIHDLPLALPPWTVGLITSTSHGADPLMDWLAALIGGVAKERMGG
jgi:DNA-binding transcriptional LysR family regulator